jgi:hypothetical protein
MHAGVDHPEEREVPVILCSLLGHDSSSRAEQLYIELERVQTAFAESEIFP